MPELGIVKRAREASSLLREGRLTGISAGDTASLLSAIGRRTAGPLASLSPEERQRLLAGSSIQELLAGASERRAALEEAMAGIRTYPEIVKDAAKRREAVRERQKETSSELAKLPRLNEEIIALERVEAETRSVAQAIADLYGAIQLQGEIAGRQETILGVVVDELRASRRSSDRIGKVVAGLTLVLVALTVVIAYFTIVLAGAEGAAGG
jgi:hypothetical protein